MGGPSEHRPFLFFAASEPLRGHEGYVASSSFHRARVFVQLPPRSPVRIRAEDGSARWEFPPDVGACLRLAVEVAASRHRTVRAVDVSRPGDEQPLVSRHVRPETLLPLLVSPEGRRLEGLSAFVPAELREFLSRD
jgi:hypothetical protein